MMTIKLEPNRKHPMYEAAIREVLEMADASTVTLFEREFIYAKEFKAALRELQDGDKKLMELLGME